MDNFDLKKYLVENKVTTNSQMINEAEGEAPLTITVEVTAKGRSSMRLATSPSEITMTSAENNSQMESNHYYIGNQKFEIGKEAGVYFAIYRHDIKEIQTMILIPKTAEQFPLAVLLTPHLTDELTPVPLTITTKGEPLIASSIVDL